jgi:hypothetical protein
MKKNKLIKSIIVIAIFSTLQVWAGGELVDKVAAIVNNELVLESEIRNFSNKLEQAGLIDEMLLMGEKIESLKRTKMLNLII